MVFTAAQHSAVLYALGGLSPKEEKPLAEQPKALSLGDLPRDADGREVPPHLQLHVVRTFAGSGSPGGLHVRDGGGGGLWAAIRRSVSVLSFRTVSLRISPSDFSADEGFLEAVFNFLATLPLGDLL